MLKRRHPISSESAASHYACCRTPFAAAIRQPDALRVAPLLDGMAIVLAAATYDRFHPY